MTTEYSPDDDPDFQDETPQQPTNIAQHTLLSYLVSNADVWALAEPIIRPEHFDSEYQPVVQYILDHTEEYKQIPDIRIIRMKTGVLLDRYTDAMDARTTQWLLDEIEKFCRHRSTLAELRRATMAVQDDPSREAVEQILQNFKMIAEISLQKDLGINVAVDARDRLQNGKEQQTTVATGYRWLDFVTGGGLPRPGLLMIPGTPGLGKSNMLTNLLCNYARQGHFCVYISLELNEQRIFERMCSIMTDTPIRQIYGKYDFVANELEKRVTTQSGGIIYVKHMKMMGTTRSHVHAYLKELYMKEGRKPDILGLDYIDLMYPMTRIRDMANINQKDRYTSQELYDLLGEWDMTGITPSQRVKDQSEYGEFDLGATAGGAPKNDIADYIIMIQRKDNKMTGYVQKGRYGGENTKLPFLWDVNTLKISDDVDSVFYELNPRFDPDFEKKQAEKTALVKRSELNRESQNVNHDRILDNIKGMNDALINRESDNIGYEAPF